MKTIWLLLFAGLFLTSCDITEKVYIHEDQSVKYAVELDMTAISQMMALSPEENEEDFPIDTVMTVKDFAERDFMSGKKNENEEKSAHLEEIFKDFLVHVKMDEKDGFFSFFTEKKNVAELNNSMKELQQNMKKQSQKEEDQDIEEHAFSQIIGNMELSFDGKRFQRTGDLNMESFLGSKDAESGEFQELAGMVNYQIEYHFPKPVESISDTTVLMSWDRKTIYLKKPINELLANPKAYNFSVVLED